MSNYVVFLRNFMTSSVVDFRKTFASGHPEKWSTVTKGYVLAFLRFKMAPQNLLLFFGYTFCFLGIYLFVFVEVTFLLSYRTLGLEDSLWQLWLPPCGAVTTTRLKLLPALRHVQGGRNVTI